MLHGVMAWRLRHIFICWSLSISRWRAATDLQIGHAIFNRSRSKNESSQEEQCYQIEFAESPAGGQSQPTVQALGHNTNNLTPGTMRVALLLSTLACVCDLSYLRVVLLRRRARLGRHHWRRHRLGLVLALVDTGWRLLHSVVVYVLRSSSNIGPQGIIVKEQRIPLWKSCHVSSFTLSTCTGSKV